MKINLALLGLILILLFGCAAESANDPIIKLDKNSKITHLKRGAIFQVSLYSAIGTGYQWQLVKENVQEIELISKNLTENKSSTLGGPSVETWTFQAPKHITKIIELRFELKREWEKEPIRMENYQIRIK